jgi:hypothetical protein
MFNFAEMARRQRYFDEQLPPADLPMSISVMKNVPGPGGPKPGELNEVAPGAPLAKGQPVLIDLPSGTALGRVEVATTSDPVSVTTKSGGSKVYQVARERLYLTK